ncbi:MAG: hypothetical protein H7330_05570, partial [Hymenobacteraceae bacterium]|nr:hypothetical protein [Hymenobacteraceae bacterium]
IGLLFLVALAYVARLIWRSFAAPASGAGCAKGCGTCNASSAITRHLTEAEARAAR